MRKRLRKIAHRVGLVFLIQIGMAGMLLAQQNGLPGPPSIKDPKDESRQRQDREATLRSAELGAAIGKVDESRVKAALGQLKEDFRRIQIVRNDVVRNLLANKPFDYAALSDEVAEINKRAERLKMALFDPSLRSTASTEPEKEKTQAEFTAEELKGALVKLCHLIDSFVENPVLKNPGTTDIKESSRAGGDLLKIIELSRNIRKNAMRLK